MDRRHPSFNHSSLTNTAVPRISTEAVAAALFARLPQFRLVPSSFFRRWRIAFLKYLYIQSVIIEDVLNSTALMILKYCIEASLEVSFIKCSHPSHFVNRRLTTVFYKSHKYSAHQISYLNYRSPTTMPSLPTTKTLCVESMMQHASLNELVSAGLQLSLPLGENRLGSTARSTSNSNWRSLLVQVLDEALAIADDMNLESSMWQDDDADIHLSRRSHSDSSRRSQ
jgi:hypothetical protein